MYLEQVDPQIAELIASEIRNESDKLNMIASENLTSRAVLEAQGCVMTNKYAEGYPRHRYYGGCNFVDGVEELAIQRAKELFGAEHINVQPHSGSQANMAVYLSVLKPGDTIMGLNLSHGGHLTHGSPANFSGKLFKVVSYTVDKETEVINLDQLAKLAKQEHPRMIVAGASAYPRNLDWQAFRQIADDVGAYLMADIAHIAGLIAAKLHPDPIPYCDFVTSTTHKTLRGPRGGLIMCPERYAQAIDKMVFPGIQGGPFMHTIAAKAVCFKEALTQEFKDYQAQIVRNAQALADELLKSGFKLISGGTDTHLILVNLNPFHLTGKEVEEALEKAGIIVNKNAIPYDPRPPQITSGIRLGTPSLTTRGMKEKELRQIARWIKEAVVNINQDSLLSNIRKQTLALCQRFPV